MPKMSWRSHPFLRRLTKRSAKKTEELGSLDDDDADGIIHQPAADDKADAVPMTMTATN